MAGLLTLPPDTEYLPANAQWCNIRIDKGDSQQPDCPGLSPGSLFIPLRGTITAAKVVIKYDNNER